MALLRARWRAPVRCLSTVPLLYNAAEENPTSPSFHLELLSWGRGSSGQLGSGREESRLYPAPVAAVSLPVTRTARGAASVACGLFHSALLVDGRLWVWGKGDGGRLGLGEETSRFVPTLNENLEGIRTIALGGIHSAALTLAGDVYTWGYGGFGALGHSVYTRELLPRLVNGPWNGRISYLATSGAHTAAVTDSGELYTWGRDEGDGRLGLGSGGGPGEAGSLGTPTKVDVLPVPVAAVCCGGFFTMALTSDGQLWSWGANANFELGRGSNKSDWQPQPIPSLQDVHVVQMASGGYHSLALTDKGEVLSWGHGGRGQLGHSSIQNQKVPLLIEALAGENIVYIACGGSSSAAITDTGKLYMWGNARDCQLGVPGLPDIQPQPIEVKFLMDDSGLGPHHVIQVDVGASHAMCLALRPDASDQNIH